MDGVLSNSAQSSLNIPHNLFFFFVIKKKKGGEEFRSCPCAGLDLEGERHRSELG